MQIVPLQAIPNQTFTILLNGELYRIALRTVQELTYMSVWINEEVLFYNQLCTPNNWVNPYDYVSRNGKFFFACADEEYPTYTKFNITQQLLFLTTEEVANEKA